MRIERDRQRAYILDDDGKCLGYCQTEAMLVIFRAGAEWQRERDIAGIDPYDPTVASWIAEKPITATDVQAALEGK